MARALAAVALAAAAIATRRGCVLVSAVPISDDFAPPPPPALGVYKPKVDGGAQWCTLPLRSLRSRVPTLRPPTDMVCYGNATNPMCFNQSAPTEVMDEIACVAAGDSVLLGAAISRFFLCRRHNSLFHDLPNSSLVGGPHPKTDYRHGRGCPRVQRALGRETTLLPLSCFPRTRFDPPSARAASLRACSRARPKRSASIRAGAACARCITSLPPDPAA